MDQDASWQGGRPRPRPHCVRWRPSSLPPERGTAAPHFSAHVCCGQTVAHLGNCSALAFLHDTAVVDNIHNVDNIHSWLTDMLHIYMVIHRAVAKGHEGARPIEM